MASGGNSSLNLDLSGLNLGDLCIPPEAAKNLGTIPKTRAPPAVPQAFNYPRKDFGLKSDIATAPKGDNGDTDSPSKRKRNRNRQKKKRAAAAAEEETTKADNEDDDDDVPAQGQSLDGRIPEIPALPSLESVRKEHLKQPADDLAAAAVDGAVSSLPAPETPPPPQGKKSARRRRGGGAKRKKQRSPECAIKPNDNKENERLFAEVKSSDDEDNDDGDGDPKYIWRSVTKNGWIKKCVLVTGLVDEGRPKNGDTVLVKSQGKLKDGTIIDDFPTLVFSVGEHEVIEGLDMAVQSMHKNELSIVSVKPEMAYGGLGRKGETPVPADARITYLFGLLHFEKAKEISQLTWAQRRKSGQSRMRLANWWYQRKEYPVAVRCYKRALEYYNNIPTNQECSTAEEYKELLQLMEERLRVMRQVANIFKRIANMIQSGQISS